MEHHLKLIRLILYPFIIFSLAIYLCLYTITPLELSYQMSLIMGFLLTAIVYHLEKPNWKKIFSTLFNWKALLLLVPPIFIILVFGFVLSPLVKIKMVDGQSLLGLTALGDYYKHLYVLTSVKMGGLPPHHPFFPSANLSYYYGYYLLPSAFSSVFHVDLARCFLLYLLVTTFIILFTVVHLSVAFFERWYQRLLVLTLFIFGTSLDIIPTLIQAKSGIMTANHIEFWSQILNLSNYLVNNIYTVLLWVPQHSFTSLIVLVTSILLLKTPQVSKYWLVPAIWFCLVSSTFVSLTFILWLSLFLLFLPHTRKTLIFSGLVSLVLLSPYLIELVGRGSILSFGFYMTPFVYAPVLPQWMNYLLTFFTEYGLILVAIPIFLVIEIKKRKTTAILITLAVSLPIIIGLFVKSVGFNDFSMRSVLPSQMALPFLMAYILKSVEDVSWKKLLLFILVLSFIPSMTGFFYEIHFRLIDRGVIDAKISTLLIRLRERPVVNLAAIDNGDWVFLVPSYGYQPIYSPRLFDSNGYLSNSGLKEQAHYAGLVNDLFIYQSEGDRYKDVVSLLSNRLNGVNGFFKNYKESNFLLPRYRGEKLDYNPWYKFMELANIKNVNLTDNYSLIEGKQVEGVLAQKKIVVDYGNVKKVMGNHQRFLPLFKGLWLIVACNKPNDYRINLEFSEHYQIFTKKFENKSSLCVGDLYYQNAKENVLVSQASEIGSLYALPVTIINRQK